MDRSSERYSSVAITLHWLIAIAIVGMIIGGMYMTGLEDGAPGQYFLFQLHKSIGITILLLTVSRIIWRVMNPPPPLPDEMNGLEKTASHLVHLGFYGMMVLLPLTGWLYTSISVDLDVPTVLFGVVSWPDIPFVDGLKTEATSDAVETTHDLLAKLTLALLALHVAGALKHEFSAEQGVLKRMIPGMFGKADKPQAPGRGALTAFGTALGAFIIIAGAAPLLGALAGTGGAVAANSDVAPNWAVNADASSISFSGTHDGNAYSGSFGNWDAAIRFDPDAPGDAVVNVTVSMASAEASQKLYSDSLPAPEWFNTSAFPTATVEIVDIAAASDGSYTSTARLTLKEQTVAAPFPFTLAIDGDTASMRGEAVFQRKPLDLGQSSDPNGDWVGEDVRVDVVVEASRLN
jgi:cytochrome b561